MTAKEWLSRARTIDSEINTFLVAYAETKDRLTKITQAASGDTVQATKDPHKYDALVELSALIDNRVDELVAVKKEITEVILRVGNRQQREVLMRRYIGGESWSEIAEGLNYAQRTVFKLHGRALVSIAEVLNDGTGI